MADLKAWGVTEPADPTPNPDNGGGGDNNGGGNGDKPDDGEADTEKTEGGATALLSAATAIALMLAF